MHFHYKYQGIHTDFDIFINHVASAGQGHVYVLDLHIRPNGVKVPTAFFQY